MKKTLVLGASTKPERYSYKAVEKLTNANIETVAVGRRKGVACGVEIHDAPVAFENVHTVTLYLNAENQKEYYDYITGLKPKRVVFNPGTENPELYRILEEQGIESEVACTLVLISINEY